MLGRRKYSINILGSGVCGLSVACKLMEIFGDEIDIVITSEQSIEETTSYIAGGLWEPYALGDTSIERINYWSQLTYQYYNHLYRSSNAFPAGIQQISVFNYTENGELPFWKDIPLLLTKLTSTQLEALNAPKQYQYGYTYISYVAEPRYFLNWMKLQLSAASNIMWEKRKVTSIDEQSYMKNINNEFYAYDVVVNCTGLNAFHLLNDLECYPIRGQILHVKAPWITSSCTAGNCYVIPNREVLIVGGTSQKNDWNTEVSSEDTETIWREACELFPSLKDVTVEKELVGLRPGRTTLKLESSIISRPVNPPNSQNLSNANLLLVHCYGLGGSGYTLGYGLAEDIVSNHILPFLCR